MRDKLADRVRSDALLRTGTFGFFDEGKSARLGDREVQPGRSRNHSPGERPLSVAEKHKIPAKWIARAVCRAHHGRSPTRPAGLKVATNVRVHPDIAGAARSDDD